MILHFELNPFNFRHSYDVCRSASSDIDKKNRNSSMFSRTISATKLCRGGAFSSQIDATALTSLHDKKTPSKKSSSSEVIYFMSLFN